MIDWSDEELLKHMRELGVRANYGQLLAELNRRSQERAATSSESLASATRDATKQLVRFTAILAAGTVMLAVSTAYLAELEFLKSVADVGALRAIVFLLAPVALVGALLLVLRRSWSTWW